MKSAAKAAKNSPELTLYGDSGKGAKIAAHALDLALATGIGFAVHSLLNHLNSSAQQQATAQAQPQQSSKDSDQNDLVDEYLTQHPQEIEAFLKAYMKQQQRKNSNHR